MQVYTGKDRNCRPEVNQGQRVVLDLVGGLENRNVTTDNFFTSYTLAAELKRRRLSLLGTVRKNRNFVPAKLLNVNSKPANFSDFVFDHSMPATMVTYKPKKNRFVLLLSTKHFTRSICEENNKPAMIMDYNATKGGVDTLDQMVGTYRSERKVNRWPMALFCNILDVSAVNALVVYTRMFPRWKGFASSSLFEGTGNCFGSSAHSEPFTPSTSTKCSRSCAKNESKLSNRDAAVDRLQLAHHRRKELAVRFAHTLALATYTAHGVTNAIRRLVPLICTKFAIIVLTTNEWN